MKKETTGTQPISEVKQSWYVASTGNHQGLIVSENDGKNIAVAYDKKDAHILAAAPEMLEALKELLEQFKQVVDPKFTLDYMLIRQSEAAIAKATNS